MKERNLFGIAVKSIAFAWQTNNVLFTTLVLLNIFQGAIVYVQFASFSAIVDEIVAIQKGAADMNALYTAAIILGVSFLVPTLLGNVVGYYRGKFRLELDLHMDLYRVEKQSQLDIGTLESSHYQNLLRSAKEIGDQGEEASQGRDKDTKHILEPSIQIVKD